MKSQVLHTVWCNISGGAAGEFWHWSLSGVKGLKGWENVLFELGIERVKQAVHDVLIGVLASAACSPCLLVWASGHRACRKCCAACYSCWTACCPLTRLRHARPRHARPVTPRYSGGCSRSWLTCSTRASGQARPNPRTRHNRVSTGLTGYRVNTSLTSLPLVSVRRHGRVTQWKSRWNFTSSASSIFLCTTYVATNVFNERVWKYWG